MLFCGIKKTATGYLLFPLILSVMFVFLWQHEVKRSQLKYKSPLFPSVFESTAKLGTQQKDFLVIANYNFPGSQKCKDTMESLFFLSLQRK